MASPAPQTNGLTTPQNATQTQAASPQPPATQQPSQTANAASSPTPQPTSTDKRPRDIRTIHAILSAKGVSGYSERVPLMLMDLSYRYTSSILSDAQTIASETLLPSSRANPTDAITVDALKTAIAARMEFQFRPAVERGAMAEIAREVNAVKLPVPGRGFGVRLPGEEFTLTGVGYSLRESWESEDEEMELDLGGERVDMGQDEEMGEAENDEFEDAMGGGDMMQG